MYIFKKRDFYKVNEYKGLVNLLHRLETGQNKSKNKAMLEVKDGKIYVEGVETIDPELIGFAFLDFAEDLIKFGIDFDSEDIGSK